MKKTLLTLLVLPLLLLTFHTARAADLPDGCLAGDNFSSTTGHPCTPPDCPPGDLFSGVTGKPCGDFIPGCYSLNGYSVLTGNKCDESINQSTMENTQNTQSITGTETVETSDTFTLQTPYVYDYIYRTTGDNNIMLKYEVSGTNLIGLNAVTSIDGTQTGTYTIGNKDLNYPNISTDTTLGFPEARDLSDGTHTATVTIGDQAQTLMFTVEPNSTN